MTGNDCPIFIGGFFKSGTSLLRAMLGQHSRIASGLETHWFEIDPPARRGRGGEPLEESCVRLAEFYALPLETVRTIAREAKSGEIFLERLLGIYADRIGKSRWLEKTPDNLKHVERIWAAWPNAKILHILRDMRDVYLSLRDTGKAEAPADFAGRWEAFMEPMLTLRAAHRLPENRFLQIRYDELVSKPESSIRQTLAFLDEPWEEAVARYSGDGSDYQKVLKATGKSSSTLKRLAEPLNSGRIGVWRGKLSEQDCAELERGLSAPAARALYHESLSGEA